MKGNLLCMMLAAVLAVCLLPGAALAAPGDVFEADGLYYRILTEPAGGANGTVEVTKKEFYQKGASVIYQYSLYDQTSYTIPTTVANDGNAYDVVAVGEEAFFSCDSIRRIVIGEGVTSIGNSAFHWCRNLESVTLPDSLKTIGDAAFSSTRIFGLDIPDGVTHIGEAAFVDSAGFSTLALPDTVTFIGNNAFGMTSLTSFTIPAGVTSIGDNMFSYCAHLRELTIPEGVTSIGWYAFSGCAKLRELTIPSSVTSIGRDAFSGCTELTDVYTSCTAEEWAAMAAKASLPEGITVHFAKSETPAAAAEAGMPDTGDAVSPWAGIALMALSALAVGRRIQVMRKD